MKKKSVLFYIVFAFLMIALGSSDALRGVFAPIFQEHFNLSASGVSMFVTVSYCGNLLFMLLGGRLGDSLGIRRVFIASMVCWMAALALYIATDNYYALLTGVFFAMGASTLLNTLLNIATPILFLAPGMIINTLFFIQSIGTTFTQGVIGSIVSSFAHWKLVNTALLIIGAFCLVLFCILSAGEEGLKKKTGNTEAENLSAKENTVAKAMSGKNAGEKSSSGTYARILSKPIFWMFVLTFGFYFIAEHGVMNWMNIYCQNWLGMSAEHAALMPSLFFGAMMVGRLVFAPLVAKLGIIRMLLYSMIFGFAFYIVAMVIGGNALYLLALSGLGVSIIYPTMVMCIQLFFPEEITTTASGTILAVGTLFDIGFNAVFGSIIDAVGYGIAMMILPVAAGCTVALFVIMIKTNKPVRKI